MSSSSCKFLTLFLFHLLLSNIRISQSLPCPLPPAIQSIYTENPATVAAASVDFGNVVHDRPIGVFVPRTVEDIIALVKTSYECYQPFTIGVNGHAHSTHGQSMALNGVVIDMKQMRINGAIKVGVSDTAVTADVGGDTLWLDVMNYVLGLGYSPYSWTDYLNLTVGGTLSNAGISGQTFKHGPQISNVQELDIVTGKGELVFCSPIENPELFYGALGGLGQFGIIVNARIPLGRPTPTRVRWQLILFSNFTSFTQTQEKIITSDIVVSYLEGGMLLDNGTPNTWRTFFFPSSDIPKITALTKQFGVLYSIEYVSYYDGFGKKTMDRKMKQLFRTLNANPEYSYEKDATYKDFLLRVEATEPNSQAHPWLNMFIPKSGISAFESGVVRDILLKRNITLGPIIFYPMKKEKWDDRMSAVVPDEDIFYTLGLLYETGPHSLQEYEDQNAAILKFFEGAGINIKLFLGNQPNKDGWIKHFGPKWGTFQQRKAQFDPKNILSPGQRIFN
ncbi:cytokinin dehydrogenase 3-like [Euphorbia lathyris]|uniref:cytokinin dehydrogenase 3-like n=1 Tax=Euphorbia lathyris TaxID=212925 RepID=UPI0033144BB7